MAGIIDRLPNLVEMEYEDLPILRENAADPVIDKNGSASATVAISLRFLGVANYVLNQNIGLFKSYLSEAAKIRECLFERFENSEPISKSYLSMMAYKGLFNALAAGDMELSKLLASHMGGRDEIEKEYDHPFDYALGYTLKSFVLDDHIEMRSWAKKFDSICREKENIDFQGYAQMFKGILFRDETIISQGLQKVIERHKKLIKGNGVFKDSEDEVLCVWGIGLANLARSRDLLVRGIPPLIPDDLLI